jgi:hypothetical protein
MSLAPWDNSGLRDRLDGLDVNREATELDLCQIARRKSEEPRRKRFRQRSASA